MIVKLLTEHHLEFLSLKGGCRGLSESTHVKMPHCWKSRALAHIIGRISYELYREPILIGLPLGKGRILECPYPETLASFLSFYEGLDLGSH